MQQIFSYENVSE